MPKSKRQRRITENRTDLLHAGTVTTLLGLPEAIGQVVTTENELHDDIYRMTRISYPPKYAPADAGPHDGWITVWATGWPEDWPTEGTELASGIYFTVFMDGEVLGCVPYVDAMERFAEEKVSLRQILEALDGVLDE